MGNFDMVKVDIPIACSINTIIEEISEELESDLWLLESEPYYEGLVGPVGLVRFRSRRLGFDG